VKVSHILSTLVAAGALAAVISMYLNPKLEANGEAQASATLATVTVDEAAPTNTGRRSATITAKADGHYWTRALVNKKASIEFMVDTGASVIALNQSDARKMGLNPESLDYKWEIRTAGGRTMGASVIIESIKINQVHIKNVEAMVLRTDLDQSLLGMSFLRELYSYEVRGDRMIIRQ
jgi:aspartyl protease family protein